MGNFDRNRNSRPSGGRSFERRGFNDRGSRGPVEMHQTVCDKCRQNCEVPFRPTSGKPVYCSNCFKSNGDFGSKRPSFEDGGRNFEDRQMFEAVCDECRNACKVPFQPSGDKPIYCSDCFGQKKGAGDRNRESSQPQVTEQFEVLNNKLDRILAFLTPNAVDKIEETASIAETVAAEEPVIVEKKVAKKKPSKNKSSKA